MLPVDSTSKSRKVVRRSVRRRLSASERKKQLIDAAGRVFARHGFHGTSIRSLAEEADIDAAIFVHYFGSKWDIFEAAITKPLQALFKHLLRQGRSFGVAENAAAKDEMMYELIRQMYLAISSLSALLVTALSYNPEEIRDMYLGDIQSLNSRFRAVVQAAFSLEKSESSFVTSAIVGLCFSMYVHLNMSGIKADVDSIAMRIADLMLYGVVKRASLQ